MPHSFECKEPITKEYITMKKRAFCLFLAAALSLSALCACTAGTTGVNGDSSAGVSISTPSKGKNAMSSRLVGISMPEQAGRWEQEATRQAAPSMARIAMFFIIRIKYSVC